MYNKHYNDDICLILECTRSGHQEFVEGGGDRAWRCWLPTRRERADKTFSTEEMSSYPSLTFTCAAEQSMTKCCCHCTVRKMCRHAAIQYQVIEESTIHADVDCLPTVSNTASRASICFPVFQCFAY